MTLVQSRVLWALSFLVVCGAQVTSPKDYSPEDCCALLSRNLSSAVFYPDSSQFASTLDSFSSLQARLTPTCVFRAPSGEDVANAVAELAAHSCQFAVKGGGYTPWAGAANIEEGVTIDLSEISHISLSRANKVAFIGAGATWSDVYQYLSSQEVAVAAGMSISSGVGGLILGGGNGFFTAQYGFTCDNVVNFVVVLANGTLVNAGTQENPDLYAALKGGSNNFGVVIRFDLTVFEQGDLWGGQVTYPSSTTVQQIAALAAFTDNMVNDPKGSMVSRWTYNGSSRQTTVMNTYAYTEAQASPAVFKNFTSITPVLTDTTKITTLVDLSKELQRPGNTRDLLATLTFVNDPVVMSRIINLSEATVQTVSNTQDLLWSVHLQPLPRIITDRSIGKGGNMLGLDRTRENLMVLILEVNWARSQDDAAIAAAANSLLRSIAAVTKNAGKDNDFIYLNYALQSQNALAGYGGVNIQTMRSVSKKFDPDGVFQNLVKGGFKLP